MDSSSPESSDNITFTLDPSGNLSGGTTYLTRDTTGVKDAAGNKMSSQYETSSGFTTTSSSGSGVFVAVGNSGSIVRSTDNGASFDNVTSPTENSLAALGYGNNTFVGGGASRNIVRSTDNGSSWDNGTSPYVSNRLSEISFSQ